jgi:hypothetical protein
MANIIKVFKCNNDKIMPSRRRVLGLREGKTTPVVLLNSISTIHCPTKLFCFGKKMKMTFVNTPFGSGFNN